MKKYESPSVEILKLDVTDIITASTPAPSRPNTPNAGEEDIF